MATSCPIGFDVAALRARVLATYDRVARDPRLRPAPSTWYTSPAALRGPPPTRLRLGDDHDYRGRMGFPGRHAHGRLYRRLVGCSGCLRECEHGVLYSLVHCSDFFR